MYPAAARWNEWVATTAAMSPRRPAGKTLPLILLLGLLLPTRPVWGQGVSPDPAGGESLFEDLCSPCHTIGEGDLVGPDLSGVEKRRPREWIVRFLNSPEAVIESGDPYAVSLFEKYDEMTMPDMDLTEAEILSILAYIAATGGGEAGGVEGRSAGPAASGEKALEAATPGDVEDGANIFQGTLRLEGGGPSCNSCHDVNDSRVLGGGSLARDLTHAYSRLGEKGLRSIIENPAFPAMKAAFRDRGLTEQEVSDLVAFLKEADSGDHPRQGTKAMARMALSGLGGAVLLLLLVFGGLWTRGKRTTVNEALFARQVGSR